MSIVKQYFFVVLSLLAISQAYGQASRSPFSTYGIGEHYGNALANNQGMGGIGVSQPQFWYANTMNPALLIYNNLTVFHAGLVAEQRRIRSAQGNEKSSGGNLSYLVSAFPVKPGRWSTSIALSPFTTVNYRLAYVDNIVQSTDQVNVVEKGSGGISQLSWSNGVRLTKELAVGLKAAYLFGSILNDYQNELIGSTQPVNYASTIEERAYVKDFAFSGGISFSRDSLFARQKYRLSFGAVYDFSTDLSTRHRSIIYRARGAGPKSDVDTLINEKGRISVPAGITGGVTLSRGKWSVGTEFSYRDWTNFRSVSDDDEGLKESWRVALGGETTPDASDVDNYLKRVTYRLGVSVEEYPFLANTNSVKDVGINFGFSLPAGRSSLDLAFKYGKRGNRTDNVFEENYFRVFFGVTFNDQWFIKRKFD
jgi:hypothetical protein